MIKLKKEMEKIIFIDVPTKIYSELRKIFVFYLKILDLKILKINENVDFQKLYNMRKSSIKIFF